MRLFRVLATMAVAAAGATAVDRPLHAQAYPTRPIRLIVPFPAGGGTDLVSRVMANRLAETNKWTFVVENKPGAGGDIGVDLAAKSAPDGYTIVMGQTSNLAVNSALYPRLPYDPLKDLAPIVLVASSPLVMVVAAGSPLHSLDDLIAAAKAHPAELTMASPGNGTIGHLSGEMIQLAGGFKLRHIPYRGASQALVDLLGGRIDVYMSTIPAALAQVKGGQLRALAVTSSARLAELSEVPTIAESGYPGLEAASWYGLLAPAGVPEAIVRQLNDEALKALGSGGVREKFATEGLIPLGGSPESFGDFLKRELARWGEVVKSSGARID